jgi:hypothetical protein
MSLRTVFFAGVGTRLSEQQWATGRPPWKNW